MHQGLTCSGADNAMPPKETKILALGIQLHLLNPHVVLGNLYIRSLSEKMAKRQSSLVNFFSKRARNTGELVIFFIQKCSKVNEFLLTSSNFFTSVFSFALCDGGIADGNLILEETKESRPPSDADPGETEIIQLQSQQETGIVCFFFLIC